MDKLIKNNISNDILYLDNNYISNRIAKIEITTDWSEDHYSIWRKHLLDQKSNKFILRDKGDRRDEYLQKRYQLLESKYKKQNTTSNNTSRRVTPATTTTTTTSNNNNNNNTATSTTSNNSTNNNNNLIKNLNLQDFSFSGMHHIFDEHKKSITRIKFANDSKDLLGFSSSDGTLTISKVNPIVDIQCKLKGHTDSIVDFEWLNKNQELLTSSLDGTIKLWLLNNSGGGGEAQLLKTFGKELSIGVVHCISIHPIIQNLLFISEQHTGGVYVIKIIDISAGRLVSRVKIQSAITCMQFEDKGNYLFLGDAVGTVLVFKFDSVKQQLAMVSKTQITSNSKPITSIQVHNWVANLQKPPILSIATNSKDSKMRVFIVKSLSTGLFVLFREIPINCKSLSIKSIFSPVFKNRPGAFLVSGGEDSTVYIYDVNKKDKPCVNQLMGHSSPVLDISWNSDESLLATSDNSGLVILWKK